MALRFFRPAAASKARSMTGSEPAVYLRIAPGHRCQSPRSGGTSRTFVGASALSMARSAAAAAADLVDAWPMINKFATDADHFQTPGLMP